MNKELQKKLKNLKNEMITLNRMKVDLEKFVYEHNELIKYFSPNKIIYADPAIIDTFYFDKSELFVMRLHELCKGLYSNQKKLKIDSILDKHGFKYKSKKLKEVLEKESCRIKNMRNKVAHKNQQEIKLMPDDSLQKAFSVYIILCDIISEINKKFPNEKYLYKGNFDLLEEMYQDERIMILIDMLFFGSVPTFINRINPDKNNIRHYKEERENYLNSKKGKW